MNIEVTLRFGISRSFTDTYTTPVTIRQILAAGNNRARLALGLPENATPLVNGQPVSLDHTINAAATITFEVQAAAKAL